ATPPVPAAARAWASPVTALCSVAGTTKPSPGWARHHRAAPATNPRAKRTRRRRAWSARVFCAGVTRARGHSAAWSCIGTTWAARGIVVVPVHAGLKQRWRNGALAPTQSGLAATKEQECLVSPPHTLLSDTQAPGGAASAA